MPVTDRVVTTPVAMQAMGVVMAEAMGVATAVEAGTSDSACR